MATLLGRFLSMVLLGLPWLTAIAGASDAIALRVLTYNIWGMPFPADNAPWRYVEIAKRLKPYDIVAFQETWSKETKVIFQLNLKTHPYRAFGGNPYGLVGGSGLIVVSRYPIVKTKFLDFIDCSPFDCTQHKGVLFVRVAVRPGVEVDLYATHLNPWENQDLVRSSQIMELVSMVHENTADQPAIVLGDFNADFRSINYDEVTGNLMLRDSYQDFVERLPNPTEEQRRGYTFNLEKNPWAAPHYSKESRSQRFDYIFYRSGRLRIRVMESHLAFTEPVREDKPLSDHYGVTTLFSISTK